MKTYFVAGNCHFYGTNERTEFWRVMNIDDEKLPHNLIEEVISEVENSPTNYLQTKYGPQVGQVSITAFNQV